LHSDGSAAAVARGGTIESQNMTIDEIKELIQLIVDSGVAEIEVQRGDNRVRIRRTFGTTTDVVVPQVMVPAGAPVGLPHPTSPPVITAERGGAGQRETETAAVAAAPDTILVKSPIVGTYYDAPSPGSAPFVNVGDAVEPGQVLCIIESMKLMNEIEAEVAGTIMSKLTENGRPVEYGEALFGVRPR
jgi:acetyl-CoA carboxylase biotin carboxyl carrier protein